MSSALYEIGPPILFIVSGLLLLGLWKTANHVTRREAKVRNTDPAF